MERVSQIAATDKVEDLLHPPFFRDHHVGGRPVLPAVEAMETLAASFRSRFPGKNRFHMARAAFDKFLFLDPCKTSAPAHNRFEHLADGTILAALLTKSRAPKAKITRTLRHAELVFTPPGHSEPSLPLDVAAAPEGICRTVTPEQLYADLVPFGNGYRNIIGPLFLGNDGALALVGSPRPPDSRIDLVLGSPYPLDAAFHAACAWGQFTENMVAFPVAIAQRKILRPTRLDETYIARIIPREVSDAMLVCDIFILDHQGNLYEVSAGVCMRDISGGRTRPPEWIRKQTGEGRLVNMEQSGKQLAVVEHRAVAPFAHKALSELETKRCAPMAVRRKSSFISARLALKRLGRNLSDRTPQLSPENTNTVGADSPRPICPAANQSGQPFCSASHDSRFAVAVAAQKPVGIDVEPLTPRAFKNLRLFTDAAEGDLIRQFSAGAAAGALRAWSVKEAAAKALDMPLAKAWARVKITALGHNESRLQVTNLGEGRVIHDMIDNHLFTLFSL